MKLRQEFGEWQERARDPSLSALLFIQAALMFVITPLEETRSLDHWVLYVSVVCEAVISIVLIARDSIERTIMTGSVVVLVFLPASSMLIGSREPISIARTMAALSFVITVTVGVAKAVFRPGRIGTLRVQGGMLLYLNIALAFALVYVSICGVLAKPFAGTDPKEDFSAMLYFSLSTLTTTGYGDLAPLHPLVRSLATMEGAIGQLFPATLLAGLIGAHLIDRGREYPPLIEKEIIKR